MSRQGKARARSLASVKQFWNDEAAEWGENPRVTIRDHYFRLLEIATVSQLIDGKSNVLDIGCGTGLSTLFYAERVQNIIGADYAEKMVDWAKRFLDDPSYFEQAMREYAPDGSPKLRGNVRFEAGDILNIGYEDGTFDAVVGERVLINLPHVDMQDEATDEVARVLQRGGAWVSVEVTAQGHQNVDRVRTQFGLPIIEKYWHNLYVDEDHFLHKTEQLGLTVKGIQRFETYQFLTKVLHPLIVAPEEPQFMAGYNDAARKIGAQYPTFASVAQIGLGVFLTEKFRPLIEKLDPEKLPGFDRIVPKAVEINPDFTGCSHQVLFSFVKN